MKIALPVDEKNIESPICISFGRTPCFVIFDTDTKGSLFLDNSAAASQGGAGIQAAQMLADHNIQALITPRCGENAAEVLNAAEIKIYKSIAGSILENVQALVQNNLSPLNEIHAGFHNHGGM